MVFGDVASGFGVGVSGSVDAAPCRGSSSWFECLPVDLSSGAILGLSVDNGGGYCGSGGGWFGSSGWLFGGAAAGSVVVRRQVLRWGGGEH